MVWESESKEIVPSIEKDFICAIPLKKKQIETKNKKLYLKSVESHLPYNTYKPEKKNNNNSLLMSKRAHKKKVHLIDTTEEMRKVLN